MKRQLSSILYGDSFSMVKKFISVQNPQDLERMTRVLYANNVRFYCEPYFESYANSFSNMERIDIIMNYRICDESSILKALGIKSDKLFVYFDHS